MLLGVLLVRVPPPRERADGRPAPREGVQVSALSAGRTPQFSLLSTARRMNVTAGSGRLEKAAP
ncbi:OFA family MFS transporter OS=Streptomyces tendae OX=1932 GN=GUR47_01635 PE=4 SV=1 [Streptomyces tendae]